MIMSGPYDQNLMNDLFKDSDVYQIGLYIFRKLGCYDIYILETSEMSQFSIPQQNTRITNISESP